MHIGLIGGLDRNAPHYMALATAQGHTVECHPGVLAGRGGETLAAIVDRADIVVVVTDVNSHGGVFRARLLSRNRGRRCVLVRRMGAARFRSLLGELAQPAECDCRRPNDDLAFVARSVNAA
jgi:hypothetical protein